MIDFIEVLAALRKKYANGDTQSEIAKNLGIGQSYFCQLISGKRPIDGLSLKKFNQLFPDCVVHLYGDKVKINAPANSGNVVGINNGSVAGNDCMDWVMDRILAADELSSDEKIKVLKVLKK